MNNTIISYCIFMYFHYIFMKLNCTFAVKSCGCLWMLIFGFPLYLQHVHASCSYRDMQHVHASCSYRDTVDFEEVK